MKTRLHLNHAMRWRLLWQAFIALFTGKLLIDIDVLLNDEEVKEHTARMSSHYSSRPMTAAERKIFHEAFEEMDSCFKRMDKLFDRTKSTEK